LNAPLLEPVDTETPPLTTSSTAEAAGQSLPLAIDKPAAGTVALAETAQAAKLAFKFAYAGVKTAVLDVDLVLLFDDGSKILLPGLALRMLGGDAPRLSFLDGEIDPQMVIARVDEVQLADQFPNLMVSASLRNPKPDENATSASGIPMVQLPSLPPATLTPVPRVRVGGGDGDLNSSVLAPQVGRFARRSNQEDSSNPSTGGGGQSASAERAPAPATEAEKPANAPPSIISDGGGATAPIQLDEGNQHVARVAAVDPEGRAIHYAIAGGPDAAQFSINSATGELFFIRSPDFEINRSVSGVYRLDVQAIDDKGNFDTQALTVAVANLNERPEGLDLLGGQIPEASPAGSLVGQVSASDPDAGDHVTYSFAAGGNAGGLFIIDSATGTIAVAPGAALDFETMPTIAVIVRATDQSGLFQNRTFVINVTNVEEAPVITSDGGGDLATIRMDENTERVTQFYAIDPERNVVSFQIVGGADQAVFAIDPATGILRFIAAPDFERPGDSNSDNRYEVIVQASDGTLAQSKTLLVAVDNVNEAPTGAILTSRLVPGGALPGTIVGQVVGTDPDAGDAIQYSFAPGEDAGGRFRIDPTTGVIRVAPGAILDFAQATFHEIAVRLTDTGGLFIDKPFTIEVINTDGAPVIISDGGGATAAVSLGENTTDVTVVRATAVDLSAVLTYSIVGGVDQARFFINPVTGAIRFATAPDFESPSDANRDNVYELTVLVSDDRSRTDTQRIWISVTNVNEAPIDMTITGSTIAENAANGTIIGTLGGVDPDAGASFSFAFVPGQDAGGRFAINASNQIVVANGALLDFEAATSHDVTVRVTDQGGLSFDKLITVDLGNVSGHYTGTSGDDVIVGSSEENTIAGLDGNDHLTGGISNDTIFGGDGDDTISGGPGNDVLYGGTALTDTGMDTLDYSIATSGISIDLSTNAPQETGGAGIDAVSGFEIVVGSAFADTITGSAVTETLSGGAGNDIIQGNGGFDLIDGGAGDDTLYTYEADAVFGGDGNDTIYASTATLLSPFACVIDGWDGTDSLVLAGSGGPAVDLQLDLVGKVTNIESIDATAPGVVIDLRDMTGDGLRSILGLPVTGGSGTLTVAIDGNDFNVSAAAGQFTSFDPGTHTTTFFADSSMTTEMAKVQVV